MFSNPTDKRYRYGNKADCYCCGAYVNIISVVVQPYTDLFSSVTVLQEHFSFFS